MAGKGSSSQPEFLSLSSGNDYDMRRYGDIASLEPAVTSLSRKNRLLSGESTATCTPWRRREYTYDPPGLHQEINDFYEYMKPRPSEIRMREDVICRVKAIIHSLWPLAKVEPFGSFVTGLYLPTSDIDLVVLGKWPVLPLFTLEEALLKHDIAVTGTILALDKTTVPIVKFLDKKTEVGVDIGFNHASECDAAEIIRTYIHMYPFLPKLVLVLKQFLTQRNLNEVFYGGISSYSLVLLLVSFLQLHPRHSATDPNTANLGVLLMEFFELYGRHFNYMKTGIVLDGGGAYIAKDDIKTQDFLYVKDPSNTQRSCDDPMSNAARGCFGMFQVRQAFEHAFLRLNSGVLSRDNPVPRRNSLLATIVRVSKEVDEYRNLIDRNFP